MTPPLTVVHAAGEFQLPSFRDRDGAESPVRETEARLDRIAEGLRQCPTVRWQAAEAVTDDMYRLLATAHAPAYLAFLHAHREAPAPVLAPEYSAPGIVPDTPVTAGAFDAAMRAVACAGTAADRLVHGTRYAYALCRPPGHHAGHGFMGGYCYLNNAVVAAKVLHRAGLRVGVLDVDFHHGNGTADILAQEPDIPFVSLHASTLQAFPYVPTAPTVAHQWFEAFDAPPTADEYLQRLDTALHRLRHRDALVLSLGYDLVAGDPHGGWTLSPSIFGAIARQLAATDCVLCIVQEGGYALDVLPACAQSFAEGLQ